MSVCVRVYVCVRECVVSAIQLSEVEEWYGVATISRLLKITSVFRRI